MSNFKIFVAIIALLVVVTQCQHEVKSEYEKIVEKELSKEVRNDSLFLGYYFGMTRKEFYEHSWKLNKEEKIVNGNGAEIKQETKSLKAPGQKIFYPDFKNEKIFRMPVKYSYNGWAPWNRHLWADSLKLDVKGLLEERYQIKFKEIISPKTGKEYLYNISANKEIRISELDNMVVLVEYIDLTKI